MAVNIYLFYISDPNTYPTDLKWKQGPRTATCKTEKRKHDKKNQSLRIMLFGYLFLSDVLQQYTASDIIRGTVFVIIAAAGVWNFQCLIG